MNAVIMDWLTNHIAAKAPVRLRTSIYKKMGLNNPDEIRKNAYIQNIKALKIGENSFINRGTHIYNGYDGTGNNGKVLIGSNVTIGYDVSIFSTTINTSTHWYRVLRILCERLFATADKCKFIVPSA